MIIGTGLLAQALHKFVPNNDTVCYLAAGVSNSEESEPTAFMRERLLVEQYMKFGGRLVFFSTCSVSDPTKLDTPYVQHKLAMEKLVKDHSNIAIFRLPQVVGFGGNPHTLINFIYGKIKRGDTFCVWARARRNLVDVEHAVKIASHIIDGSLNNCIEENIASQDAVDILQLVKVLEEVIGLKAKHTVKDAGAAYEVPINLCLIAARELDIDLEFEYASRCIKKYYGN